MLCKSGCGGRYFCFVELVLGGAWSWHGAFCLFSSITFAWFQIGAFADDFVVVGCDNGCYTSHATVAQLQIVPAAHFVQLVLFRQVFLYELQEFSTDAGLDVLVVGRVKPSDVASSTALVCVGCNVFLCVVQLFLTSSCFKCCLVCGFGRVEYLGM